MEKQWLNVKVYYIIIHRKILLNQTEKILIDIQHNEIPLSLAVYGPNKFKPRDGLFHKMLQCMLHQPVQNPTSDNTDILWNSPSLGKKYSYRLPLVL